MVLGCGIDICDNRRFNDISAGVLMRLFTPGELAESVKLNPAQSLEFYASRFAAKEAFAKALGTGFSGFSPLDLEVRCNSQGRPFFAFSPKVEDKVKDMSVFLSLSHEKEYSVAMVVLDGQK